MATIEKDKNVMTLVNVFTVKPEKQAELDKMVDPPFHTNGINIKMVP